MNPQIAQRQGTTAATNSFLGDKSDTYRIVAVGRPVTSSGASPR